MRKGTAEILATSLHVTIANVGENCTRIGDIGIGRSQKLLAQGLATGTIRP